MNYKQISKFLSLVLRHHPEEIGLHLDEHGWASVEELISKLNAREVHVNFVVLEHVVETNDKKRFAFNDDKTLIRASQGHSIPINLELTPTPPPDILYHGTATRFLSSIMKEGLVKGDRQHVHLTAFKDTAFSVGGRHGKPIVLEVDAAAMVKAGFEFYLSANHVWLVEIVLPEFINAPEY